MSKSVRECAYTLERLEEPDSRGEFEAIGRCGEHVYQFTRLDDGTFMVTHRLAGGKVEVLNSAVRGGTCYETALQHRRANCCRAWS
jgi:hypothetical protein